MKKWYFLFGVSPSDRKGFLWPIAGPPKPLCDKDNEALQTERKLEWLLEETEKNTNEVTKIFATDRIIEMGEILRHVTRNS